VEAEPAGTAYWRRAWWPEEMAVMVMVTFTVFDPVEGTDVFG
jgi:hypothetical protein